MRRRLWLTGVFLLSGSIVVSGCAPGSAQMNRGDDAGAAIGERAAPDASAGGAAEPGMASSSQPTWNEETTVPPDALSQSGAHRSSGEPLEESARETFLDAAGVVTNPADTLVLVNKRRSLPPDYVPDPLVVPDVPFPFAEDDPKKQLRQDAARAVEQLFSAAAEAGLELFAQSGYRSYERQEAIFAYNASQKGADVANQTSAHPGESEHQTGLSLDVTCAAVDYLLVEAFGETAEGRWLTEHAHQFGLIIRYPKGKEEVTGYSYEPWHLRYVGVEAARKIAAEGLTLEEYLGL